MGRKVSKLYFFNLFYNVCKTFYVKKNLFKNKSRVMVFVTSNTNSFQSRDETFFREDKVSHTLEVRHVLI